MLKIRYHTSFKKDYKRVVKRGYDTKLMEEIIQKLARREQLPEKNKDHSLGGDYIGCREYSDIRGNTRTEKSEVDYHNFG